MLFASDLNAEFVNIYNNGSSLILPFTAAVDFDGNELILDSNGDTSITADTDDQIDFRIGGTDRTSIGTEGFQGNADILLASQVFGD